MSYNQNAYGVINVNTSPSFLFNNLTCNGTLAVFLKGCKLISFQEAALSGNVTAEPNTNSLKDMIDGLQVEWCLVGSRYYLVCASYSGIQIYGADGKTVEYVFPLQSSEIDFGSEPEGSYFTRGISGVAASNQICVGASTGHIFIFDVTDDGIDLKATKACHKYAISAMCNIENILASGDDYGNVILWDVFENYGELCRFQGDGHPCTGLVGKNGYVVSTYTSGHIRVFNVRNQNLFIEIAGHSRAITGIDMHPANDSFVTVGEDSIINVWQLPVQEEDDADDNTGNAIKKARTMTVTFSTSSPSAIFTGVRFSRNGTNTIFASVYDQNDIRYWTTSY